MPSTDADSAARLVLRVAVPGIALAGAAGLVWAGRLAHSPSAWLAYVPAILTVLAVALWVYRRAWGGVCLIVIGLGVTAGASVTLLSSTTPWELIGFWGGSAIALSGMLHLMTAGEPDRSTTATVAAVLVLLIVSSLGLSEYVRLNWSPEERAIIETLPIYASSPSEAPVTPRYEPVNHGEWGASWFLLTRAPRAELLRMQRQLEADGWRTTSLTADDLTAEKGGFTIEVTVRERPGQAPEGAASDRGSEGWVRLDIDAHVRMK